MSDGKRHCSFFLPLPSVDSFVFLREFGDASLVHAEHHGRNEHLHESPMADQSAERDLNNFFEIKNDLSHAFSDQ